MVRQLGKDGTVVHAGNFRCWEHCGWNGCGARTPGQRCGPRAPAAWALRAALRCSFQAGSGQTRPAGSNNASPDPPGPALLSHAQVITPPAPLARLGELVTVAENQDPDFFGAGVFAIFMGADYLDSARDRQRFHWNLLQSIQQGSAVCISFGFTKGHYAMLDLR